MCRVFIGVLLVVVVGFFGAAYWHRCHGAPLSREAALRRAAVRLERFAESFNVGDRPAALVDAQFEPDSNSWLITYRGDKCSVAILVDRCHGDDVGGTTGCSPR